jgi:hypothetical protein
MNNTDILQTLMSLGQLPQQQNPMTQQMQNMRQSNPSGYLAGIGNPAVRNMMTNGQPQGQQPSWLDALNTTMMMGGMMQPQQQYNPYGMGGGMMSGPQKDPNWWQKGLQGTGAFLQGASGPATNLGATALGMGIPYGGALALGGVAGGGLGNLFQYLGQPGQVQPTYQGGWS